MSAFQDIMGRDRLRMRENKISVPIHSNPTRNRDFQKYSKKIEKIENINMASFKAKTGRDQLRMREKKKLSFRSIQTQPGIGNSKKIVKKFKNINMASFKAKTGWDRLRMREKK